MCPSSRKALPLLAALLALATGAAAQTLPYVSGAVGFHYQQFPFGSYRGDFAATGTLPVLPVDPVTFDQAVGGFHSSAPDSVTAVWYAIVGGSPSTMDVALLWMRRPGAVLAPGSYPIDPLGRTVLFAYADGVSGFTPPDDPAGADLADWLAGVVADHVFLALSGSVTVASAGSDGFSGTFSGLAGDASPMLITISNGTFALDGIGVSVEEVNWGDMKAAFR
jgi:hypothetical protein